MFLRSAEHRHSRSQRQVRARQRPVHRNPADAYSHSVRQALAGFEAELCEQMAELQRTVRLQAVAGKALTFPLVATKLGATPLTGSAAGAKAGR